jgi:hypothetical protein
VFKKRVLTAAGGIADKIAIFSQVTGGKTAVIFRIIVMKGKPDSSPLIGKGAVSH